MENEREKIGADGTVSYGTLGNETETDMEKSEVNYYEFITNRYLINCFCEITFVLKKDEFFLILSFIISIIIDFTKEKRYVNNHANERF